MRDIFTLPKLIRCLLVVMLSRLTQTCILLAVMGTVAMKDYVEAGFIVFLFTIAEWLECRAGHKVPKVYVYNQKICMW